MDLDIGCGSYKMPGCLGIDVKRDSMADVLGSVYYLPWVGGFEVVHLREVLEHLERPLDALEEVRHALKPGGVLHLTVPNMLSIDCILRWGVFGRLSTASEHISGWTLPDLIHLLERAGFQVVRWEFETPGQYYRKGGLRRLFSWLPRLGCKSLVLYCRVLGATKFKLPPGKDSIDESCQPSMRNEKKNSSTRGPGFHS